MIALDDGTQVSASIDETGRLELTYFGVGPERQDITLSLSPRDGNVFGADDFESSARLAYPTVKDMVVGDRALTVGRLTHWFALTKIVGDPRWRWPRVFPVWPGLNGHTSFGIVWGWRNTCWMICRAHWTK